MYDVSDCPICFHEKPLTKLQPCGHAFCCSCVHKLLQNRVICPMCRKVFNSCIPGLVVFDAKDQRVKQCHVQKEYGSYIGIIMTQKENEVIVSKLEKYCKHNIPIESRLVAINNIPLYNRNCVHSISEEYNDFTLWFEETPVVEEKTTKIKKSRFGQLKFYRHMFMPRY